MLSLERRLALAVGCAAMTVAGCSREAAGPAHTNGPTNAQMLEFGNRFAAEFGASLRTVSPTGLVRGTMAAWGGRVTASILDSPPDSTCPRVSNQTDSDHDGVPDDAVLLYTLPACHFVTGGDTVEITGIVHIQDPVSSPAPNMSAFGFVVTFDHLRMHSGRANPDSSVTDTRTGNEVLMMTPQRLNQGHAFTIAHEDHQGVVAIEDDWNAAFSPDSGTSFAPGQPLPPGAFAIGGRSSFARGSDAFQFAIGTAVPLRYDPSCPDSAPNRFRSGELRASVAGSGQHGAVRIVFADCKDPTVTPLPIS